MNTGHIYITGQIGSSYDAEGNIIEKGVELIDVVEQMNDNGSVEKTIVHINSPGGFVEVGKEISNLLATIKNCHTVAEKLCASIATKVFISVPLENRTIEAGTEFMIHNPFLSKVSGDAEALKQMAIEVEAIEKELEKDYAKATGMSQEALSGLMKLETTLTAEQCVKWNFASAIASKTNARALALIQTNPNMKKSLITRMAVAMAVLQGKTEAEIKNAGREALAVMIETDNGTIETPFADVMEMDTAMIDGEPAPDGDYVITAGTIELMDGSEVGEGTKITVADGVIVAIEVATDDEPPVQDKDAEALKLEIEDLKAKLESKDTELSELKNKAIETENSLEVAIAKLEEVAKIESTFTPPSTQANARPSSGAQKSAKEKLKEAKERYATK